MTPKSVTAGEIKIGDKLESNGEDFATVTKVETVEGFTRVETDSGDGCVFASSATVVVWRTRPYGGRKRMPAVTDRDRLLALLSSFGISVEATVLPGSGCVVHLEASQEHGEKIGGYVGFYTEFTFDAEGRFVSVGAWE